jgi:hypothetical protein
MASIYSWIWLTVLLPFLGFLVNGYLALRRSESKNAVSAIGVGTVVASFVVTALAFAEATRHPIHEAVIVTLWSWMPVGDLALDLAFQVDHLALTMLMVVTGVGSLIHVFSVGYMKADPGYPRYFAYLHLFIAFMVVLVGWIALNLWLLRPPFDPAPFIGLNLLLSMLAALQAPVIMMSQNRQDAKDRVRADLDYQVNLKSEIEIMELHRKVDRMKD